MLNLIKMDIYRMFHSLSTWVILVMTVGLAVFAVIATNLDLEAIAEAAVAQETSADGEENQENADDNTIYIGIQSQTDPSWVNGRIETGELLATQIQSGLLVLLCVIITAIFSCADTKSGYIKNIAGQLHNRGLLAVSKIISMAVLTLIMMVVFSLSVILTGLLLWQGKMYVGDAGAVLPVLGTQYLLHVGFCALVLLLCTLTKSSAVGMSAGIVLMIGLLTPVYSMINYVFHQINGRWNFDITRYMLEGNMAVVGPGASSNVLIHASLVGAVFILAGTVLAVVILKKRDVR